VVVKDEEGTPRVQNPQGFFQDLPSSGGRVLMDDHRKNHPLKRPGRKGKALTPAADQGE
jgi:hypothetical protein